MRFNIKKKNMQLTVNLAGGEAFEVTPELELAGILLTSFTTDQFYRQAQDTIDQVVKLVQKMPDKTFAAKAAVYARNQFGMRSITHVVAAEIAKSVKDQEWTKRFFEKLVRRPDDATEILALYMKLHARPIPNSLKKGIGLALGKFDAYQIAKYRAEGSALGLVDIVNLCHPKPTEKNREALSQLVNDELRSVDTWESELTRAGQAAEGEDKEKLKGDAWKKLVLERKLGYFALLRNLRNILTQAEPEVLDAALEMLTDDALIRKSLVMPFRFNTAFEVFSGLSNDGASRIMSAVSVALERSLANVPQFPGKTLVVLDGSGSMMGRPIDIGSLFAAALYKAMDADIMLFSDNAKYLNFDRRDTTMTVARELRSMAKMGGTNFHSIFQTANRAYDRIIILSDMQGWMGYYTPRVPFREYKLRTLCDPRVYSFDLQGYGTLMFPEQNVYCLAGMSDKVFEIMKLLDSDRNALLNTIRAVEL